MYDDAPPTPLDAAERIFAYVSLFLFSNAFIGPLFAPHQQTGDEVAWLRYVWLPVYAGTVFFFLRSLPRMFQATAPLILFSLLAAWIYLSTLWTINSETTSRRAFAFVATSLFGLYFGARFRGGEGVVMIARVGVGLAVGSLLAAIAYPTMGVAHDINAGDWRGLWYEKNSLGAIMALGAFSCVSAAMITGKGWRWAAGAALCIFLVLMSKSKTALLCVLLPAAIYIVVWLMRRGPAIAVAAVFLAVTAGAAVVGVLTLAPGIAFNALGKDATLTGRTQIWASLFRRIAEQPLTGYGYAAFWEKTSLPAKIVRRETGWSVPTAHNGWIDVLVQIGWVGAVLMAMLLAVVLICGVVRGRRTMDGSWAIVFTATYLLRSLSESVLIQPNSFDWMLFVFAGTTVMLPLMRPAPVYEDEVAGPDWADPPLAYR